MRKYRTRTEIAASVLEIAKSEATKSRILSKSNISYARLEKYLLLLVNRGLLEYGSHDGKYRTTETGREFIQIYREMTVLSEMLRLIKPEPYPTRVS